MDRVRNHQSGQRPVTRAQHAGGAILLALALALVSLIPYLPSRAAHGTVLPFLYDRNGSVVLAYAGFPGCGDTCPRGLASLAEVYTQHQASGGTGIELLFINVQRNAPDSSTRSFAEAFHAAFDIYTVGETEAEDIYRQLALRSYDEAGGAVYHSDYVYIFKRQANDWHIEKVYRSFPSIDRLLSDVRRLADTV